MGALYRSSDGGTRWELSEAFPFVEVPTVRFAGSPRRLFVAGWSMGKEFASGALLVSYDGGATFASVLEQPFVHDVIDIPSRPGELYAAASSSYFPAPSQRAGIYRSLDNGTSWTRLEMTVPHTYMWALAMFPDEPDRLLIATNGDGVIAARL